MSDAPALQADQTVYRAALNAFALVYSLSGSYIEVHGREFVPPPGTPLIIAANHIHNFDPYVLTRGIPPESGRTVQFMAKKELFVGPVGWVLRRGGTFPVDRGANDVGSVRTALRVLQAGGTLGIFPEGTRGGGEMHAGVALLSRRGRAPILPAGICHQGRRWVLRLGEPIPHTLSAKELMRELETEINRLKQPIAQNLHLNR